MAGNAAMMKNSGDKTNEEKAIQNNAEIYVRF